VDQTRLTTTRSCHVQDRHSFNSLHTHTHTTVLRPFFRDHPGEPVPEENFWTLWCKGRLIEADTPTIQLGASPSGLTSAHLHHPPILYRWMPFLLANQQCLSTEGRQLYMTTAMYSCLQQTQRKLSCCSAVRSRSKQDLILTWKMAAAEVHGRCRGNNLCSSSCDLESLVVVATPQLPPHYQ